MRPLSLRTWGRILTENGEIIPFLNKQPCISVIFIPKNSFPNRKAVFVSALEKPDIIDFPFFASFLPQPPDRTRRKNLGQKRCEKCVQQKGNRIACFAKYPEASMRCAVFAEMDWEAK